MAMALVVAACASVSEAPTTTAADETAASPTIPPTIIADPPITTSTTTPWWLIDVVWEVPDFDDIERSLGEIEGCRAWVESDYSGFFLLDYIDREIFPKFHQSQQRVQTRSSGFRPLFNSRSRSCRAVPSLHKASVAGEKQQSR